MKYFLPLLILLLFSQKVGWVDYKKQVTTQSDKAEDEDKEKTQEAQKFAVVSTEANIQEGENKQFLALVIKKHIPRSPEEKKAAKKAGKSLSSSFSIDIPISLIPRVYTAFAYIYRLQGGEVSLEYPAPLAA